MGARTGCGTLRLGAALLLLAACVSAEGQVASCPAHCANCTAAGKCTECEPYESATGRSISLDETAGTCIVCPSHCAACTSAGKCTRCDAYDASTNIGASLDEATGTCIVCPANCEECSSTSRCTRCATEYFGFDAEEGFLPGLYLDAASGTCKACPANCAKCDRKGRCTRCRDELLLWAQDGTGLHPYRSFTLDAATGTCVECPDRCKFCPGGRCARCMQGSFLDLDGSCQPCPELCAECKLDPASKGPKCLRCDDFWAEHPAYWDEPDEWDFPVYMDKQGNCQKCTKHSWWGGCTRCSHSGRCIKCEDITGGVTLDWSTGRCVKCKDELCARCDVKNPDRCLVCQRVPYWVRDEDWFFSADHGPVYRDAATGKCLERSKWQMYETGCNRCSRQGECIECADRNSYPDAASNKCKPCSTRIENCATCSLDGSRCKTCKGGFKLQRNKCLAASA